MRTSSLTHALQARREPRPAHLGHSSAQRLSGGTHEH